MDPSADIVLRHLADVNSMSAQEKSDLFTEIVAVDEAACGKEAPVYWSQRANFLEEISGLIVARQGADLVGFLAYQLWRVGEHEVIYADSTAVLPSHQGQYVGKELAAHPAVMMLQRGVSRFFLAARTENPIVVSAFIANLGPNNCYPRVDDYPFEAPPDFLQVAERVHDQLSPDCVFDATAFVSRRAFAGLGGFFFQELPEGPPIVMRYFHDNVRSSEGDAVVLVASVNLQDLALGEESDTRELIDEVTRVRSERA